MSMIYNYAIIHWQDANGNLSESFCVTQNQSPGGETAYLPLCTALQNCSDAAVVAVQFVTTTIIAGATGTGPYKTVWDRGVLLSKITATNRGARTSIVGPKAALFLPGNQIINLANTQVLALQTQVDALLGDSVGNAMGPFQRGIRATAAGS